MNECSRYPSRAPWQMLVYQYHRVLVSRKRNRLLLYKNVVELWSNYATEKVNPKRMHYMIIVRYYMIRCIQCSQKANQGTRREKFYQGISMVNRREKEVTVDKKGNIKDPCGQNCLGVQLFVHEAVPCSVLQTKFKVVDTQANILFGNCTETQRQKSTSQTWGWVRAVECINISILTVILH